MTTRYSPYLEFIDAQKSSMVELLRLWAGTNSGSHNLPGLEKMLGMLKESFSVLAGEMRNVVLAPQELIDTEGHSTLRPLGEALYVRKRPAAAVSMLLCCHMDTVYAADHPFQETALLDENTLQGPGVTDAKGGIVVMLKALEAFEASPWAENVGWEVVINPDEEIGSPGSLPVLLQAARNKGLGLVFEPSFPDGDLVGARKGSGNFVALARGKAAHAGREPHLGRNAIHALARFIVDLNALDTSHNEVTINVGSIEGGGPVNVVPDRASCRFNVRVADSQDEQLFQKHLLGVSDKINFIDGISLDVRGSITRPPKPLDGRTLQLLDHVAKCGRDLGLSIRQRPTGGSCDGNNLAAAGLPTIDSLGVRGGGIHSSREYVLLDSLTERAILTALLLMKLGSREISL